MTKIIFLCLLPFLPFAFSEAMPLHQENFLNGNSLTCLYEIYLALCMSKYAAQRMHAYIIAI